MDQKQRQTTDWYQFFLFDVAGYGIVYGGRKKDLVKKKKILIMRHTRYVHHTRHMRYTRHMRHTRRTRYMRVRAANINNECVIHFL